VGMLGGSTSAIRRAVRPAQRWSATAPTTASWRYCSVASGSAAASASSAATPAADAEGSIWQKVKKELIKVLKMQLVLFPVAFGITLWMYPPLSDKEEQKLKEKYEKSAGWKT
jgi:hypothetical protein